jgi:hypothetical protein
MKEITMLRRTIATLAITLTGLAAAIALPAAAHAAPTVQCTDTFFEWTVFDNGPNGPVVLGTQRHSYVGSALRLGGTYRIWHVTFQKNGSSGWAYNGAYAAKCDSADEQSGTGDLTREEDEKLTSFDLRCGTANFVNGSTNYTYIGSRSSSGDTFRYWGTRHSATTYIFFGVTAARCD